MTYKELLRRVAIATEYPEPICEVIADNLSIEAAKGLARDGKVNITGLMTMEIYDRKGRKRYDPNLGSVRYFQPSKDIKCILSRKFKSISCGKEIDDEDE